VDADTGRLERCGWDGGDWTWQSRPWGVRRVGRVGREGGEEIAKLVTIQES